jgi:5'-nucleotidase
LKIILTNDDGYGAPGLEILANLFPPSYEVMLVAPKEPQSGIGHRVTTRDPISTQKINKHRIIVDGTPADCARIALKMLVKKADWLVAGINPGANLGSDVYGSGTVAAAREAAILGCRSIAISQYIAKAHTIDWEITGQHAKQVLNFLMKKKLDPNFFWNVNLPHPLSAATELDYSFCDLDTHPHRYEFRDSQNSYHYEGTIHERPFDPNTDVAQCFAGKVSITRLSLK